MRPDLCSHLHWTVGLVYDGKIKDCSSFCDCDKKQSEENNLGEKRIDFSSHPRGDVMAGTQVETIDRLLTPTLAYAQLTVLYSPGPPA